MSLGEAHTLIDNYFHAVLSGDPDSVKDTYQTLFAALLGAPASYKSVTSSKPKGSQR